MKAKRLRVYLVHMVNLLCFLWGQSLRAQSCVDYVNPLIGTQSSFELSAGNTYPVIGMPWGMNSWTPMTGKPGDGWQYTYTAHKLRGFKQTHQPSPWINDYGQFALLPLTAPALPTESDTAALRAWQKRIFSDDEASWFSHKAETATPYYYSVYLADYDTRVEMTPTERAAVFRVRYPEHPTEGRGRWLRLDGFAGGSEITVIDPFTVIGTSRKNSGGVPDNFACYFVLRFDNPIVEVSQLTTEEKPGEGKRAWAACRFEGRDLTFRVASSFISHEQARVNLSEAKGNFDEVKQAGRAAWEDVLGRIQVEGGTAGERTTFYSALYRCLLFPRRFYEIDSKGDPIHYSPYNGSVLPGYLYTDTGFWDTFRALFPLLNLLYPDENIKMQEGLLNAYRESGFFPEWASPGHRDCMVGNNSASVLADAYLKGVQVADTHTLMQGLLHGTRAVHPQVSSTGRKGWEWYNTLGYVPADVGINESAARTLEYAYNDWCIYRLGSSLGWESAMLDTLAGRALNYRHLFDPETRLMRGRHRNGSYRTPFSPLKWGDVFTEGNAWHYTWSVFHDVQGLIDLMGGEQVFAEMLDSVFSTPPVFDESYYGFVIHEIREMQIADMGNYAHGNQPIQHMVYLYNYAGRPWQAQQRVREVMSRLYNPTPDGYCGDEDNGQTSAWYVFSALGFYPVTPGTDQYVLGSPLFSRVVLRFPDGGSTVLEAPNNGSDTPYVRSVEIDAKAWSRNYLTHEQLRQSSTICWEMDAKSNLLRGTADDDKPYSFSVEKR
ncbi:GH92 family glycosyl hydrolase [Porphyromonas loveana]|uniref:GH92 family glycosyl hydrolase n=1 Tax=Porphyromonas loveana TaxID=1884669 RepID=UPI0035A1324D